MNRTGDAIVQRAMNALRALKASALVLSFLAAAGCASSAPRTQAKAPAGLDGSSVGAPTASTSALGPNDYDFTMTDSPQKAQSAKSEPTPPAGLKPSQATAGHSVLEH